MSVEAVLVNGEKQLIIDGQSLPLNAENMAKATALKPSLVPVPLGLKASFGFGDRIGLATPGHVESMKRAGAGVLPMYPQQSIREMGRTSREPIDVMNDAQWGALLGKYTDEVIGSDADHLKTPEDVDRTVAVGFSFFTIDPSDHVDQVADNYSEAEVREKFEAIKAEIAWYDTYVGTTITLSTGTTIVLDEAACMRAAVKYGKAITEALKLGDYIKSVNEAAGKDYEIELSVDETEQPTTLAEHYIIADQCVKGGMKLVSLAPRYIGEFEKGVDYKGDLAAFEKSLADHAAIAKQVGPYKLSLHSGSDKLSIYGVFGRVTEGMWHVKTAGTSYLEALRVVAIHDMPLFKELITFGRERYPVDKATYHVSATNENVPGLEGLSDEDAVKLYLENWADVETGKGFTEPGRQILHCTFGSTLCDEKFGPAVFDCLKANLGTYTEVLADHFAKHLEALTSEM